MGMVVNQHKRFDVCLVVLNPVIGHEINKTRPCLIISPDEMNDHLETVIIAPMTTKGFPLPCRAAITFQKKKGLVVCDHMRSVDKKRLVKHLGKLDKRYQNKVLDILAEMFA